MGRANELIDASKLFNWKLLDEFRRRLVAVKARAKPETIPPDPKRLLLEEDYFSLVLFGLLSPALPRMDRALWQDDQNRAAKLHLP